MNKKIKAKNKITANKGFILAFSALILTILLISSISSQFFTGSSQIFSRANVAVSPSSGDISFPFMFNREMCEAGQDFILQISPTGCVPSVVRSDLLEEQNVPVFCPIVATQLNPLINVEAINTMTFSFSGERPPEVSGIGYYPARAALGRTGQVTQPIFNNLGYAVIVLKQQRNESAMPDFVGGNLTARIRYDIKNAFGVGQAVFYLPEITNEEEWNRDFKRYSFWDGRGYLRAESISDDRASIAIYSDRETHGWARADKRKIASKVLRVGETSGEMFMPGFDYCLGSMQLKLNGLEAPDTRARLNINGDIFELKEKEKFIDNKCKIKSIDKQGLVQKVTINCQDDYRSGTFPLTISPRINLSIEGISKEYSVGDILYKDEASKRNVFLGYIGEKSDGTLFIIPTITKHKTSEEFLDSFVDRQVIKGLAKIEEDVSERGNLINGLRGVSSIYASLANAIMRGSDYALPIYNGSEDEVKFPIGEFMEPIIKAKRFWTGKGDWIASTYTKKTVGFVGLAGPKNIELSEGVKDYYEKAIEDYEKIRESFSQEKYPDTEQRTLSEQALLKEIKLAETINQKKTALELCQEFEENYPDSEPPNICAEIYKLSNPEGAVRDVVIDDRVYRIAFDRISEPDFKKYGARISVIGTDGFDGSYKLEKNQRIKLSEREWIELEKVNEDNIIINTNLNQPDIKEVIGVEKRKYKIEIKAGYEIIGSNKYEIRLHKINLKKVAKVSVKPNIKYTQTEATFPFKIGIEKRAIQLSPEKTKERIESLNNTIEILRSISGGFKKAVEVGRAACLGVGGWLTVKNFFANLKGEGIARQKVMRDSGGWFDICEEEKRQGNYRSVDSCLLAKNSEIEASVEEYAGIIEEQNERFNELQEGITKKRFLGEDIVDTKVLMERYVDNDYRSGLKGNIQGHFEDNKIRVGNEDIDVFEIIESIKPDTTFITQARSLQMI